jgi:hypothetical protein
MPMTENMRHQAKTIFEAALHAVKPEEAIRSRMNKVFKW